MSSQTHTFPTRLGDMTLRYGEAGISAVLWPARVAFSAAGATSAAPKSTRPAPVPAPPESVQRAGEAIAGLLSGERVDLGFIQLDTGSVSDFARDVYAAAREIPAGETASYGELARGAGHPGAAREVGVALARNPFPIVVPCHRVLAADGSLHGFSAPGGLDTKRRMLEIEGAPGFEQQPLFA